jgi:hypothetical protein
VVDTGRWTVASTAGSFLGQLGTSRQADAWSTSLWQAFFCTTLGAPVPIPNFQNSRANPRDNSTLTFHDFKRVDQPLEDRARTKTLKYTPDYANNTRSVFAPAAASTPGRIQAEFIRLLFLHAHRGAEEHPGHDWCDGSATQHL